MTILRHVDICRNTVEVTLVEYSMERTDVGERLRRNAKRFNYRAFQNLDIVRIGYRNSAVNCSSQ